MLKTKSGLPKHCCWATDRHGKRRVRFRKAGFSSYITGTPWSEDFMRQYAAAQDGVKARVNNAGVDRTIAGTVNAVVAAYLDPLSSSPFKNAAAETQRTRRNILENFRRAHGDLPIYRTVGDERVMLLKREHMQKIVNKKSGTPFAQRNFLNTLRVMFQWAMKEGRIPDDPTLGVTREKTKTSGYKTWSETDIERLEVYAYHRQQGTARLCADPLHRTAPQRCGQYRMSTCPQWRDHHRARQDRGRRASASRDPVASEAA